MFKVSLLRCVWMTKEKKVKRIKVEGLKVNRKGKECEMIVWLFNISESEKKVREKNDITALL